MKKVFYIIATLFFLNACSIKYALNGKPPPDFSKIIVGTSMHDINGFLGRPQKIKVLESGKKIHIYQYKNKSGASYMDAALNGVMFIGTAGLWEALLPWESDMAHVNITYDENDKVATINRYVPLYDNERDS